MCTDVECANTMYMYIWSCIIHMCMHEIRNYIEFMVVSLWLILWFAVFTCVCIIIIEIP